MSLLRPPKDRTSNLGSIVYRRFGCNLFQTRSARMFKWCRPHRGSLTFVLIVGTLLVAAASHAQTVVKRPSTSTDTGTGFWNAHNAYDGNIGTYASLTFTRHCSSGIGKTRNGTTWAGFEPGWKLTKLYVAWHTNGNSMTPALKARSKLEYSTDNGNTWTTPPNESFEAPPDFARPGTIWEPLEISLPAGALSQAVQVRVIPEIENTEPCTPYYGAAVSANVYEIWADAEPPTLTLFLDADGNFNPLDPESDHEAYVPGARLEDGTSEALPQNITLIAAYVVAGTIVAPPSSDPLSFSLDNVSQFKGVAMNAYHATRHADAPDFDFPGDKTVEEVWFDNNDKTARIQLRCWDYGALATANAAHDGNGASLEVPRDTHGNWIADAGWFTTRGLDGPLHVDDIGSARDVDEDSRWRDLSQEPSPTGNPSLGIYGDGLTTFEEYRGFVVNGLHYRTNPQTKDLFVSAYVVNPPAEPPVNYGSGFAWTNLPLVLYQVWGEDEVADPEYRPSDRVINANRGNAELDGRGEILGSDQRALRVYGSTGKTYFGVTWVACTTGMGGGTPNETSYSEIVTDRHFDRGRNFYNDDDAEISNEISRTIAHEIGHGLHVRGRNESTEKPECNDGNSVGADGSVMNDEWMHGPAADHELSRYNTLDRQQIRLHIKQ